MFLKRILILLIAFVIYNQQASAQKTSDYSANWKKVADLEKRGLPATALKEVISIFNLATETKNDAQQLKASMFQMRFKNIILEDNTELNIFYLDTLIAKTNAPVKNILQSMQAELFLGYKNSRRYRYYNRTKIVEENGRDISTWSIEKLRETITRLYKASLKNDALLKNTSIDGFDAILEKDINSKGLRPTLYDFLAHRALEYFMSSENDITRPAYKFILNDERIFAPARTFISTVFTTKDSISLYYNAILLLQDILRFHINDSGPDALLDADLIRLNFMYDQGVITGRDQLYENALKDIEVNNAKSPLLAEAIYLRAKLYYTRGTYYEQKDQADLQHEFKRAKDLCDEAIRKFPGSYGALNCYNLVRDIETPSLSLQTEKVNIPGQPFRSLLNYKNISQVYFRVIKTSRDEMEGISRKEYNKYWSAITGLKPIKSWSVAIPDLQDYHPHSVEIKTDALPPGMYVILASINATFNLENNIIAEQVVYVSNISYIDNHKEIYVLDRDNGMPLANAEVQLWKREYNNSTRNYDDIKAANYIADNNGHITTMASRDYSSYFMQVKYKGDELFTDDWHYSYNNHNSYTEKEARKTFLFTDRSIYRPGQTVFFKGIILITKNETRKSDIITNYKSTLILYNTNREKLATISVLSNEYGSFNGSFKLPVNGLNGQFSIRDSVTQSEKYFSVEEYKRPKFIVEIKKPEGTYRLNDSIHVVGNARAYSGNNIDGSKVSYRVIRTVQYPMWLRGYGIDKIKYPRFGSNEQLEITNGETTTDANGEFFITFKAIPDETADKKNQPLFYYEVSADVTDLNGETRSASNSVGVSYQALQLNIIAPERLDADSLNKIKIKSNNINGIFEEAVVTLNLQKLVSPGKILRERYWNAPDQFIISRADYEKNFPYDIYGDEDNMSKWVTLGATLSITDTTSKNSKFNTGNSKQSEGWYKLIATTKDKYGEEVKAEKYIKLTHEQHLLPGETFFFNTKNDITEPGENINYNLETGFEKLWLIQTINRIDNTDSTTYPVILKDNPFSNEIKVTENDRGGISVAVAFIQHNRFYRSEKIFSIPWNNKDLKISYETFRDKILPGSNEKWKIRLSGIKSEKITAEALINMYDASLDQYNNQYWDRIKSIFPEITGTSGWLANTFGSLNSNQFANTKDKHVDVPFRMYDRLGNNGWNDYDYNPRHMKFPKPVFDDSDGDGIVDQLEKEKDSSGFYNMSVASARTPKAIAAAAATVKAEDLPVKDISINKENQNDNNGNDNVQIRKNFNETAFFFPALNTDVNGNIEFSFTIPEALTSWKMMTLAHTKDLASAYSEKTVITQKPLMVQPNAPRFLREGDRMEFSAKVVNLSDSEIIGTAQLELFDAATNKPVDGWFKNMFPVQYFTVAAGQSTAVKFPVDIPVSFNSALSYRIKAISKDGSFSDGEEAALPVLINRTLVTETMPLNIRNETTKDFKFEKLLNSNNSGTLSNHVLTVEYTSNPAWYAVQALPYLIEYPYECAEQSFNRYYANVLASFVSNSVPKIKAVFEEWKTADTSALLSNLQKNEELKSALLQETPWVLAAQNENTQKKNIAVLFDMVRLSKEKEATLNKLKDLQTGNGGFSWFKGGRDDRYITQYIITGIGHLRKLHALENDEYEKLKTIVDKALPYLDARLKDDYDQLRRYKANLKENHLSYTAIQYLYMRSFFSENKISSNAESAYKYYRNQAKQYWLSNSKYMQAMIALALYRTGDEKIPTAIIRSLKENAIYKEEMGMYFKEFTSGGYYWHQAPIESQAMIIEAFTDINKDNTTVDDLKTWLLKQKQTQNWSTTKATAEACYALLLNGNAWLSEEKEVSINLGNIVIKSTDNNTEAGTGYFKKTIPGDKVQQGMGNITVSITSSPNQQISKSTSWGAIYWQYFEDLDKITATETPLKLVKKLFVEKNSDRGPVLQALNDGEELHIGDKVKVRIELKVDRDMEYIHMKDMRAACMEPVNVISQYKWQDGLGYYESTKDASTNFFFSWLPRGSYVFEYPMFVTHSGNFSNGITTIQCMYAPEFTSHSEGIRVNVAEK